VGNSEAVIAASLLKPKHCFRQVWNNHQCCVWLGKIKTWQG